MKELKVYEHPKFGKLIPIMIDGQPWFVAKDIADSLGYSQSSKAVQKHVLECDRKVIQKCQNGTIEIPVGIPNRGLTVINESGLFTLILKSKLERAREYQHWVTSEVLPSIHHTGGYGERASVLNPDGSINGEMLIKIGEELTQLQKRNDELLLENSLKDEQIKALEPKADYYDYVMNTPGLIYTSEISKNYGMSSQAFNKMLHEFGIIYKLRGTDGTWLLYQQYTKQDYAKLVDETNCGYDYRVLKWTQKGRLFLYYFLKSKGILPIMEQDYE